MRTLTVNLSLSLDGVLQAPGRPGEDDRGGFTRGGWAAPYFDPVMAGVAAEGMAASPALLFGRRTYEDFFSVWPKRKDNMFTDVLNASTKFVASRTLREPLPWENSVLLAGEAATSVARLKETSEKDLVVLGSGALVRSLLEARLVDTMILSIHPLVLGSGRRLFPDDGPFAALELSSTKTTSTGVVIASYRPLKAPR
jgi:dihydrofolate reductase